MRVSHAAAWAAVSLVSLIPGRALAQHKVPPEHLYERLICVVPMAGRGTPADPKRPLYAPTHGGLNPASKTTILAYKYVLSDDRKFALVQFAARDRAAFRDILADRTLKPFLSRRDTRESVEAELKKFKKDFDMKQLELRVQ